MKKLSFLVFLLSILSVPNISFAEEIFYGIRGHWGLGRPADLITLNPITGAVENIIGITGLTGVSGLAINPSDGTIYASGGGDGSSGLYTLNPDTGAATYIGGGVTVKDMGFDSNGDLYGVMAADGTGTMNQLATIDLLTGSVNPIGGYFKRGVGLAFDSSDTLYVKEAEYLYTVNKITGDILTTLTLDKSLHNTLGIDSTGTLYSHYRINFHLPVSSQIVTIDPQSGLTTLLPGTVPANSGGVAISALDFFVKDIDEDDDGYNEDEDCDDKNSSVYPGAPEICNDAIDNDCNGKDDVSPMILNISGPSNPVMTGTEEYVTLDFSDSNLDDHHDVRWNWGDGTYTEYSLPIGSRYIEEPLIYSSPGVYTLSVTLSESTCEADTAIYQYIVVYDPYGGFVTGGGWINSPEGAFMPQPFLTGKGSFGFVSKYKKGASTPTGVTEFQFRMADLNFHSDNYEWLVVAGVKSQFKGVGTINGEGQYNFILTAIDADINSNDNFEIDRFRIKIWAEDNFGNEDVIYDNSLGDDTDYATTEIGGGSIVIHKEKNKGLD